MTEEDTAATDGVVSSSASPWSSFFRDAAALFSTRKLTLAARRSTPAVATSLAERERVDIGDEK
jgi:hypothetical protein